MRFQIDFGSLLGNKPIATPLQEKLNQLLDFSEPTGLARFLQTTAAYFYARLGEKTRWYISSALISQSQTSGHAWLQMSPSEHLRDLARAIGTPAYRPGQNGVFLMTHDVDYLTCYQNISWLAELEASQNIVASYNFLVHAGYTIDSHVLQDLRSMGHEIGLHGYLYDLRLAYRQKTTIFNMLKKAKETLENLLGEKILGFRNHSLLLSHTMLAVIAELGFLYDTGIFPNTGMNDFNTYFCFPFKYRNTNLHEIPVLYPQDTEMFRSAKVDDKVAVNYFMKKLTFVRDVNGVACLNHHPTIIAAHKQYYGELLEYVASETLLNTTPAMFIQNYVLSRQC